MDDWAAQTQRSDVLAQIGDGAYEPRHMQFIRRLSQAEFATTVERAELTVAHAGMGTVITAGRMGRPLVLLPRIQDRGEHTTDHQIATANWLRDRPGIYIADTDADLP
ncbi:MAG: glycosyltransferase, partial [Paracoccaceae bacterium]